MTLRTFIYFSLVVTMEISIKPETEAFETITGITQQHQNCGHSSFTCHLQTDPITKNKKSKSYFHRKWRQMWVNTPISNDTIQIRKSPDAAFVSDGSLKKSETVNTR